MSDIRTVQLGQFTDENADRIAAALDDAGIVWWIKRPGGMARMLFAADWGPRLFVDEARLDEAEGIVSRVLDD